MRYERVFNKEVFERYKSVFVQQYDEPYIIQEIGKKWKTCKSFPIIDRLIIEHLEQKLWIGTRASFYPEFAFIDFDNPEESTINSVIERIELSPGEYDFCSSPSYMSDGSRHLFFKPIYNEKPVSGRLMQKILKERLKELPIEIYPQTNRKFRLPFGKDQYLLDEFGGISKLHWTESMHFIEKIDRFDLIKLKQLPKPDVKRQKFNLTNWENLQTSTDLWKEGLQSPSSRNNAQFRLAQFLYRRKNLTPEDAKVKIKKWIRDKHNGFSKDVNNNKWNEIDREIDRQVDAVWEYYNKIELYPDYIHNLQGWITRENIIIIGKIFPKSLVNQRRLFKLICHYNARSHHNKVFISGLCWEKLCGNNYKQFQQELLKKGLLEINNYYKVNEHPKSFKLNIKSNPDFKLLNDGRGVQVFEEAVRLSFRNKKEAIDALNLNRIAIYRIYK